MSEFLALFLIGLGLTLVGGAVLIVLSDLRARLARLESRTRELERRLAADAGPQGADADRGREQGAVGVPAARRDSPAPTSEPPTPPVPPEEPPEPSREPVPGLRPSPARGSGAAPSPRRARRPRERVEWERWLGVRGAGLLGGVVGALAAVLLFVHAVQEGWISPQVRVWSGVGFGALAAASAERLHTRGYRAAADGLLGAGATAWFAALWAAAQRYELLPVPAAFVGMVLAVAWSTGAAWRHRSQAAALLVLGGGFAAPLLLGGPEDRPWALFGHLALVDLALLLVLRRLARRWLGALAFVATAALQVLWLERRFDADETGVALLALGGFALLFAAFLRRDQERGAAWRAVVDAPLPMALLFAGLFTAGRGIELDPWLLAAFVAPLQVAARALAERDREPWLPTVTALGALGLLALAVDGSDGVGGQVGPALAAAVLAVGAASLVSPVSLPGPPARVASAVGGLGAICFGSLAVLGRPSPEALWVQGAALAVAAGLARLDLGRLGHLGLALAFLPAAVVAEGLADWSALDALGPAGFGLLAQSALVVGVLGLLVARAPRPVAGRLATALVAVATGALARWHALLWNAPEAWSGGRAAWLFAPLAIGLWAVAVAAGERRGRPWTAAAPILALAWTTGVQIDRWTQLSWSGGEFHRPALAAGLLVVAVGLLAPRLFGGLARSRVAAFAEALAALVLFGATWDLSTSALELPDRFDEVLPAALVGGAALASAALARRRPHVPPAPALIALAAAPIAAVGVMGAADVESATLTFGVMAGVAALVGRWLAHPVPRWAAALSALAAAVGCAARLLEPYPQQVTGRAPFDRLGLEHALVFAGVAIAASVRAPALAGRLSNAAAGVVGLVWLSVTVLDRFAAGERLPSPFSADGAAGLALSLAWAAAALALLALGLARGLAGPRRASLAVLLVTLTKVFLVDLGDLEGLERVGSLAGLATSLILVSLAYQRFVLGAAQADDPGGSTSDG